MSELLMHPMGGGTGSDDLTATAANVLSGKTAVTSDSDDEAIEGTMANNGAMDVTLTPAGNGTTSKEVAEGYYSGGTITADGAAAYSAGHSQGVTDADNRVNTSSASYNRGYTNGYNSGKTDGSKSPTVTAKGSASVGNYTSTDFYLANGIIVTAGFNGDNLMTQQILWKHGATIDVLTTVKSNSSNFVNLTVNSSDTSHVSAYGRYMTMYIYKFS